MQAIAYRCLISRSVLSNQFVHRRFYTQMSSVTPVFTNKAPAPVAPYSQAVKAGGFVYISGQVPLTAEGKLVEGHEDIQVQARQVLLNLKNVVEGAGSSWEKLVKINIFITDMSKFGLVNEIYSEFFSTHKPARSCVAVKSLPLNVDVEIEAIALE